MFTKAFLQRSLLILIASLIIPVFLFAQANQYEEEVGDVVEISPEEVITIRVEAEKPTVITDIKRQKGEINVGELKRPVQSPLFNAPSTIKPRLADIEVKKVEKPKKMLAKVRTS